VNPDDYDKVSGNEFISILGVKDIQPGKQLIMETSKGVKIPLTHTLNEQQIEWFKAGGAINTISKK